MTTPDPTPMPAPEPDVLSERWREIRDWKPFTLLRGLRPLPRWFWPYGGVGIVIFVTMWPAWVTSGHLLIAGDTWLIHYPWFVFWRDEIGAGEFPLWNPYTFSGLPALATPQSGYAYPPHWLMTPVPSVLAINWLIALHVMLAGLGTAWCAGKLGAPKDGQFLAGVIFALGGAMTARMVAGHLSFIEGIAWLPVATGLAISVTVRHRIWPIAIVVGLIATAAQPEVLIFAGWWLPLWAGACALKGGRRAVTVALGRTVAGIALGVGLAAFFLIPVVEFEAMSNRGADLSWDFRAGISLPPWHLITAINPDVFGIPDGDTYWPGPPNEWHERLLYVGLLPLLAAFVARGRVAAVCLAAATIAIVLAFGRHTPLYGLIDAVPGYDQFRIPSKHLLLAALAIALAAGVGLARYDGRRFAMAGTVGAVLLLLLSLSADVWLPPFIQVLGGSSEAPATADLRVLAAEARDPLLLSSIFLAALAFTALLPAPWSRRAFVALAVLEVATMMQPYWRQSADPHLIEREALEFRNDELEIGVTRDSAFLGNYGPAVRIKQPGGYTSMFSGPYQELLNGDIFPSVVLNVQPEEARLLYLFGYDATLERNSRVLNVFDPAPPPAWVANCSWPGGALEARDPAFPVPFCVTRAGATEREAPVPSRPATLIHETTDSLTVSAEGPGWLIAPIPWYPGWSVEVDGRDAPLEKLDGALIGVELPAGEHTVHFSYWPGGLTLGLIVTGLSGLAVAGLYYAERRDLAWTRFGLEPPDRVVGDEADDDGDQEPPQDDRGELAPAHQ